jgi:vitamin B12/bleomycin/antimicrobial peptide transport system ATP-binding/permease protein
MICPAYLASNAKPGRDEGNDMQKLSLAVLATAVLVLVHVGLAPESFWQTGIWQAALGLTGLALAYVTWRSTTISTFLRIFSAIFAAEYVLTALGFLVSKSGYWPVFMAAAQPPISLPFTIAIFGLIIYAISFIPVIRQITSLADPYFEARSRIDATAGALGFKTVSEGWLARFLLVTLVVINQLQVGISLRLSFNSRDIFDALSKKDAITFWYLVLVVFVIWAAVSVVSNLIEYYLESVLKIRWRRWLTDQYSSRWLDRGTQYRLGLAGVDADNPDQRIAEDVRGFLGSTYAYSISLLSQISNLVSFSILLWSIPAQFAIPGTSIIVPGLPFWVALIYAVIGTWLTHKIGKPLVKLDFAQERYEANFRFGLARLREYTEQTALLRGEAAERERLGRSFGEVIDNYFRLVSRNLKLTTFTSSLFQTSVIFPYVIVAPYYFAGTLSLGQLQQTAGAFGRVEGAMSFFISRYASLASFKAIIDRLTTFGGAIKVAQALGTVPPCIEAQAAPRPALEMKNLTLRLPDGNAIVRVAALNVPAGQSTLLVGPSGSGKSTLFRAIAGIWPYGEGVITMPENASLMLMPQRPYIPSGSLRGAVTYPATQGAFSDDAIIAALEAVHLGQLTQSLDSEEAWSQRLSGGEQQRLAVARALLAKPDWLFLDEATAALDEPMEASIYASLKRLLPETTVVSIGHRSTLIAMHAQVIAMQPQADGGYVPVPRNAKTARGAFAGVVQAITSNNDSLPGEKPLSSEPASSGKSKPAKVASTKSLTTKSLTAKILLGSGS